MSVNKKYLDAILRHGGIPSVLSPNIDKRYVQDIASAFDGIIFCGGGDIDPHYYGEENKTPLKNICSARDSFESLLFNEMFRAGKPTLGICRGMQIINVFLGGNLYQNIDGHMQTEAKNIPTHRVTLVDRSLLKSILKCSEITVNSFHHQAIKNLAPSLTVDAVSPDGYIEAFHYDGHRFLLGVQWHPEACYDEDNCSGAIFDVFIRACGVN